MSDEHAEPGEPQPKAQGPGSGSPDPTPAEDHRTAHPSPSIARAGVPGWPVRRTTSRRIDDEVEQDDHDEAYVRGRYIHIGHGRRWSAARAARYVQCLRLVRLARTFSDAEHLTHFSKLQMASLFVETVLTDIGQCVRKDAIAAKAPKATGKGVRKASPPSPL